MKDEEILALYQNREDSAIRQTAEKYDSYCKKIARNILGNGEDAEECVNDAYLRLWNTIPPERPASFSGYLGKIVRNISLDRFRHTRAEKRGGGEMPLVLDELAECVSGKDSIADVVEAAELVRILREFLNTLPETKRGIFLCRYWVVLPVSEIAERYQMSPGHISVILNRIRTKLRKYLQERGYEP